MADREQAYSSTSNTNKAKAKATNNGDYTGIQIAFYCTATCMWDFPDCSCCIGSTCMAAIELAHRCALVSTKMVFTQVQDLPNWEALPDSFTSLPFPSRRQEPVEASRREKLPLCLCRAMSRFRMKAGDKGTPHCQASSCPLRRRIDGDLVMHPSRSMMASSVSHAVSHKASMY